MDRRTFLQLLGAAAGGVVAVQALGTSLATPARAVAAAGWTLEEAAAAFDFDPDRIFRFVADDIRYEPYGGVLRGPEGTLMAGAGNSADKAILLAALLEASQIPCRFAEAPLPAGADAALLASATHDADGLRRRLIAAIGGVGGGGRPFPGATPLGKEDQLLRAAGATGPAVIEWAEQELRATLLLLEDSLVAAELTAPDRFQGLPDLERIRHLWVQAMWGPGWRDLDPSVSSTTSLAAVSIHDTIPDDLRHVVAFRIILERVSAGALREETVVDVSEFADVLAGSSVGALNVERGGLKALGASITAGVDGRRSYVPCLVVGERVALGSSDVVYGPLDETDPFGTLATALPGVATDGETTAEWLEIIVSGPGREQRVVRRELFDRIGPAARAAGDALAAVRPVDFIHLRPDGPADPAPILTSHWLALHTGPTGGDWLAERLAAADPPAAFSNAARVCHLVQQMGDALFGIDAGVALFEDGPNITGVTIEHVRDAAGSLGIQPTMDIWLRSLAAIPLADAPSTGSPPLLAGALAHLAERLVAGDALRDPGIGPRPSVGAVFETARELGVGIRVLKGEHDLPDLPFAADTLARLRASLDDGWVAIVPERAIAFGDVERVGWWLHHPATGATIDQMDDGRGSVGLEYATTEEVPIVGAPQMQYVGQCVTIIAAIATLVTIGTIAGTAAAAAAAAGTSTSPRAFLQRYLVVAGGGLGGGAAQAIWNSIEGCA